MAHMLQCLVRLRLIAVNPPQFEQEFESESESLQLLRGEQNQQLSRHYLRRGDNLKRIRQAV
jgi:predicted LPLAT superfamily acyltransferase